jgi:hypothetical protein
VHILPYLESVLGYWLSGFWFLTALPEVLSYVLPDTTWEKAGRWLDSQVQRSTRRKVYLMLALLGLAMASFSAWEEQYDKTQMDWEILSSAEIVTWRDTLSAFQIPYVTVWYAPRDEDVAITVAKAMKDAGWTVAEIRESEPVIGIVINYNGEEKRPAVEALKRLCQRKFNTTPEISNMAPPNNLSIAIGRKVP